MAGRKLGLHTRPFGAEGVIVRMGRSHGGLLWVRAEVRGPEHSWRQYQGCGSGQGGEVRDRKAE